MRLFLTRVAWLGVLAWVVGSIYFAWVNNADFFQRMGSFGVAAIVLYFAVIRRGFDFEIAEPTPQHDIERDEANAARFNQFGQQFNQFGQWMHLLFERTSFLADVLKHDLESNGKNIPPRVSEIASQYKDDRAVPSDAVDWDSADMKQRQIATDRVAASEKLAAKKIGKKNRNRVQNILDVSTLIFSTLQWGFGDLWIKNTGELVNALH